jgi:hypothetical protein
MTIEQTIEVPVSRRITLDIPPQIPVGKVILSFTPAISADDYSNDFEGECPLCAKYRDPETGNPRYNAETAAAIEEGMAISRGEISAKRFKSLDEMWEDLERDDPDD